MKGLLTSFKHYFIFTFLILILLFFLWLKFLVGPKINQQTMLIYPPSPIPIEEKTNLEIEKPKQNPFVANNQKVNFNYQGFPFNPPTELTVYKLEPFKISFEQALSYAKIYGFSSEEPKIKEEDLSKPPFFLWQEEEKVFSVGGSLPVLHFNNYQFLKHTTDYLVKEKDDSFFRNKAQEELQKLKVINFDLNSIEFFYFKTLISDPNTNQIELVPTNKNGASYLGVGLTYQLAGFPVITDSSYNQPVFLIFDQNGNLFELTVYLFPPTKQATTLKTLPFNQALNQLNHQAIIFSLAEEETTQLDFQIYRFNQVNLWQVKIAYYLSLNNPKTVLPYYVFAGETQEENGKPIKVKVLLPVNPEL